MKKRRGRPPSKVSTAEYHINRFMHEYEELVTVYFYEAIDQLIKGSFFDRKVQEAFSRKSFWDSLSAEAEDAALKDYELKDIAHEDIVAFMNDEVQCFRENLKSPTKANTMQWFFTAGLYYACRQLVKKKIFDVLFNMAPFDVLTPTSLIRYDKKIAAIHTTFDPSYELPVKLASDLSRKVGEHEISRKDVKELKAALKEPGTSIWLDLVAKKLQLDVESVRRRVDAAQRYKMGIEIHVDKNGREYLYVK